MSVERDRGLARTQVTNLHKHIVGLLNASPQPSRIEVDAAELKLAAKEEALKKLDGEVLAKLQDEEVENEALAIESYEDKVFEARAILRSLVCARTTPNPSTHSQSHSSAPPTSAPQSAPNIVAAGHTNLRVPRFEVPSFSGIPSKWRDFWSQFELAVHNNPAYSKIDKLACLRNRLTGAAQSTIVGFPLQGDTYDVVVKLLHERYGRQTLAVHDHIDLLMRDSPVVSDASSVKDLRHLHDFVLGHVRALDALGVSLENFAMTLYPILTRSVPQSVLVDYSRSEGRRAALGNASASASTSSEADTSASTAGKTVAQEQADQCRQLLEFLESEIITREQCRALRAINDERQTRTQSSRAHNQSNHKRSRTPTRNKPPRYNAGNNSQPATVGSFVVTNVNKPNSPGGVLARNTTKCVFCSGSHESKECRSYSVSLEQRRNIIKTNRLCFRCFGSNHVSRGCSADVLCSICKRRHPTALHDADMNRDADSDTTTPKTIGAVGNTNNRGGNTNRNIGTPQEQIQSGASVVASTTASATGVNSSQSILLQTATALASGVNGHKRDARVLFDTGSHYSYVTSSLSRELGLRSVGDEIVLKLSTFSNSQPITRKCRTVEVHLEARSGTKVTLPVLEIDDIGCNLGVRLDDVTVAQVNRLNLLMADNFVMNAASDAGDRVDIIIGGDNYNNVVNGDRREVNSDLVAVDSKLGWTLMGATNGTHSNVNGEIVCKVISAAPIEDVNALWQLDHIGITDANNVVKTADDVAAEEVFRKSIKYVEGRYEVGLPWKNELCHLGSNERVAAERLRRLVNRLTKDPEMFKRYDEAVRQYIENGHAEVVDVSSTHSGELYYMPHRAVIRDEKETTKMRIVFDGSSHAQGQASLNDHLLAGPNLNPELIAMLVNFREHRIAIGADIKQAFLQVCISSDDRDALRFFWIESNGETVCYRMKVLPFGLTSSPFLLASTIKHHIQTKGYRYPQVADILDHSLYVDDMLSGFDTVADAKRFADDAKEFMEEAGMTLRKWASNSAEVESHCSGASLPAPDSSQSLGVFKVLGIGWNRRNDTFFVDVSSAIAYAASSENTKRCVLQVTARIFDPMGFLSPFVIAGRTLFQSIWKAGLEWDEPLGSAIGTAYVQWKTDLAQVDNVTLPRHYYDGIATPTTTQAHVFCDASPQAYACAVYIRAEDSAGNITTSLVMAKARVAPLKQLTLPRLELMGALIAARLYHFLKQNTLIRIDDVVFWTDSTIGLNWVKGDCTRWKPFVANRVQEIQQLTNPSKWRHCPGNCNPADLATRGIPASQLVSSTLWWSGPTWLREADNQWPQPRADLTCDQTNTIQSEQRSTAVSCQVVHMTARAPLVDISRYSSLPKARRVVAYVMRFVGNLKGEKRHGSLTAAELDEANRQLIQVAQRESFAAEVRHLQRNEPLGDNSVLKPFAPFIDEHGLVRIGGRLHNAPLEESTKHPIVLPGDHPFTRLLVSWEHKRLTHAGTQQTLASLRDRYWIIRGRQIIKGIVSRCVLCRRFFGRPGDQITAPLPKDRVEECHPFEVIGVDFAGPLYVHQEKKTVKSYVALFTCAVTRAVHFELLTGLTTNLFLQALRRFFARRGICRVIYSDNALTFQRASNDLSQLWRSVRDPDVLSYLGHNNITWKFIVPRAAWWGGFYERMVRSMKTVMKIAVGRARLSYEELETVLCEAEALINSRPLCDISAEPSSLEPLSPGHFLVGKRPTKLPESAINESLESTRDSITRRIARRRFVTGQLWRRWHHEYLLQLRSFHTLSSTRARPLQVGDVVILQADNAPRLLWRLGRIIASHVGRDGLVRSYSVRLATGNTVKRPCQLLYPLEVSTP